MRVHAHLLEQGRDHVEVHAARWDGGADGPATVCVHGLGGSHLNWSLVGAALAADGPVWALDLTGFGLTPPQGRRPTIEASLDLARGFARTVSPDRPVRLMGNSMGGLIACVLAAREPDLVAGLVLIGPAVPPASRWPDPRVLTRFLVASAPAFGERWLARRERWLTPAERVRESLELCTADPDATDDRFVRPAVRLATQRRRMPHAQPALLGATRSLVYRLGPGRRRLWADVARVRAPTLVLHGARDRLVVEPSVRRLAERRPEWDYRVYPDLGHLVMVEDPTRVAADVRTWWRAVSARAGTVASGTA